MADRLEDRIRAGAENMYQSSTPVEELIPSDLAQKAGKPIPDPRVPRIKPTARRQAHRGWLIGVAGAAAMLLISVPVVFLADDAGQQPAAPSRSTTSQEPIDPFTSVNRSVTARFEGESGGFHYEIFVFAAPLDGNPPRVNSSVEVELFASPGDINPTLSCFAGEKTIGTASSIEIDQDAATASFQGEYEDSSCFFGNVTFDLVWTGVGSLVNEISPSSETGQLCRERYAATASGTLHFSSGPITDPITVASSEATLLIAEQTACLTTTAP